MRALTARCTYARARARRSMPGASLLPFVAGRRRGDARRSSGRCAGVAIDPERARRLRAGLRLHAARRAAGDVPARPGVPAAHGADDRRAASRSRAVGLVHIANRIVAAPADRASASGSTCACARRRSSRTRRGRTFSLVTEARVGGELVWEDRQHDAAPRRRATPATAGGGAERVANGPRAAGAAGAEWRLGGDLGRRYAARLRRPQPDPHARLTAKLFGFPRAIAHGMWTKARCLAALEGRLPDALHGRRRASGGRSCCRRRVTFVGDDDDGRFAVRDARRTADDHPPRRAR